MLTDPPLPAPPAAPALSYDELPEGSELRREYDGRGGLTITAPAGDLPPSVRRALGRAGLAPAAVALGLCLGIVGFVVLQAARSNRLDPSLRTAALVTLGFLGVGVFLFVWLTYYSMRSYALTDARRRSTVVHADASRLLVEIVGPAGEESLDTRVGDIVAFEVAHAPPDGSGRPAPVPCLRVALRDGSARVILAGHHLAELSWAAAALAETTGVPAMTPRRRWPGVLQR